MKFLLALVMLTLPACTTMTIKPDGEVVIETPRKVSVATEKAVISTSEMLLDQDSVRAITKEVGEVIK